MIRIENNDTLVLTPKSSFVSAENAKKVQLPLERAYRCPSCNHLVYGVFSTDRDHNRMYQLNFYSDFNETASQVPVYKSRHIDLVNNEKYQHFWDQFHADEGSLFDRIQGVQGNRCPYVKLYFERNVLRMLVRLMKDLSGCEISKARINGKLCTSHEEMLDLCQQRVGTNPAAVRMFIEKHPYCKFVPDLTGKGPEVLMLRFRHEASLLHSYYEEVIHTNYECVHETDNIIA